MALVFDTGPVLALLDRDDPFHAACLEMAEQAREALVLVAPTLVEIDYWVGKRLQPEVWTAFVEDVEAGAWALEQLAPGDLSRAAEFQAKYRNLDLGFVDASVAAVCERLGETKLATLDRRHFGVLRPRHCKRFRLLPEPG